MTRPYRLKKNGCDEIVRFTEKRSHEEESCPYVPYRRPFDARSYTVLQLYDQILDDRTNHRDTENPNPNPNNRTSKKNLTINTKNDPATL